MGTPGDKDSPGGVIDVFDADVDPADSEFPESRRHYLGQLTWDKSVVEVVSVKESRQRERIATKMFHLAREINPELRHSDSSGRSYSGEKWVAAVSPEEAAESILETDVEGARRFHPRMKRMLGLFSRPQ